MPLRYRSGLVLLVALVTFSGCGDKPSESPRFSEPAAEELSVRAATPESAAVKEPETDQSVGEAEVQAGDRLVGQTVEREGEPDVTYVDESDAAMSAAIDHARQTADEFAAALDDPQPDQASFAVKVLIEDGQYGEHMWINPVRHVNGRFRGTLNNVPDKLTNVQIGDPVDVPKEEISDWMYVDDGVLRGGYTIRVLRDHMDPAERASFEASVPFRIE